MHHTHPDGSLIRSLCDFCSSEQSDQIMIEGHQGSLICLKCLSVAFADVSLAGGGHEHVGKACTMCLEERQQPQWESALDAPAPLNPPPGFVPAPARICLRCIKQAATALEKDPETGWKRPVQV